MWYYFRLMVMKATWTTSDMACWTSAAVDRSAIIAHKSVFLLSLCLIPKLYCALPILYSTFLLLLFCYLIFYYSPIHPFTKWLVCAHPVHSDFRLSWPVDCYVNNLKNGVILSYINDEIKIVTIQKSVLYNDGNLVIILSIFFSPQNDRRKI